MIIDFIKDWKELIISFLKNYPLVGVLTLVAAILVYLFYLRRRPKPNNQYVDLLIVFGSWVILVPILGFIFSIAGTLLSYIISILKAIASLIIKLYEIYEKHPILLIVLSILGVVGFFIWNKWYKHIIRKTYLKIIIIIATVLLLIFFLSPIVGIFSPSESTTKEISKDSSDDVTKEERTSSNDSATFKNTFIDTIQSFNNK